MRLAIDLSALNCFVENSHFQMEHLSTINKIPSETGSLHDQTGPERCLSISCNSTSIPEIRIPTLHLEKQDLPVQVTSFRTEYRPVGVHSVIKTSSNLLKKTRYQSSAIPRRHAYHWISLLRDSTVHTNYCLYYKPGEKSILIPTHDSKLTARKDKEIPVTVSPNTVRYESYPSNPSPTSGPTGILPTCCLAELPYTFVIYKLS